MQNPPCIYPHQSADDYSDGGSPLNSEAEQGEATGKNGSSRLGVYHKERDLADRDSSSGLSPYLAAGVISARELVRETMKVMKSEKIVVGKDSGVGVWVQEIGKFYT